MTEDGNGKKKGKGSMTGVGLRMGKWKGAMTHVKKACGMLYCSVISAYNAFVPSVVACPLCRTYRHRLSAMLGEAGTGASMQQVFFLSCKRPTFTDPSLVQDWTRHVAGQ